MSSNKNEEIVECEAEIRFIQARPGQGWMLVLACWISHQQYSERMEGYFHTASKKILVLEYANGGNLYKHFEP